MKRDKDTNNHSSIGTNQNLMDDYHKAPDHWSFKRMYGHSPGKHASKQNERILRRIEIAIATELNKSIADKRSLTAQLYQQRSTFPHNFPKGQIEDNTNAKNFFYDTFYPTGSYLRQLNRTHVNSTKVAQHLTDIPGLRFINRADTHETHIHHGDKHIYTLHRGRSAFYQKGAKGQKLPIPNAPPKPGERPIVYKHGFSDKQYVLDDMGVPTSRRAYAIKSGEQTEHIEQGQSLKGRFVDKIHHNIMTATLRELAELNVVKDKGTSQKLRNDIANKIMPKHKTVNDMLFMHQMFGSGDRQRGVSITTTPFPLLSNSADPFAQSGDPNATRLTIDLAKVPVPDTQKGENVNLVNLFHKIPDYENKRVKAPKRFYVKGGKETPFSKGKEQLTQQNSQRHIDWSTGKNREVFLRELKPNYVIDYRKPTSLEKANAMPQQIGTELNQIKPADHMSMLRMIRRRKSESSK